MLPRDLLKKLRRIEIMTARAANTPLAEALTATEVGTAAAFLSSPLASGITGTTIYVDKGYHAMGMAVDRGTPGTI
jgi:enoyl-[acyl-carrier-protein] reductase (NADH)